MKRSKPDATAWRSTPEGIAKYNEVRAEAQARANAYGFDQGIEANDLFKYFHTFQLPGKKSRTGHELSCEVVSCEDLSKCRPGHGP